MAKESQTGGVKPMEIAGRFVRERERLFTNMTDAERAFRKQWLKDQELSPNEPRVVPEMYKAKYNPIRRFYRYPLDQLEKALLPITGPTSSHLIRYFTGKALMGLVAVYWVTYYFKYNANDWTRFSGWRTLHNRPMVVPGDPGYPKLSDRSKPQDYADRGFKENTLNL